MQREPIFNIPGSVTLLIALLAGVHVVRTALLSDHDLQLFDATFAFNPLRYEATLLPGGIFPGGSGAQVWSFVTYAFIHADLMHLMVNTLWLLPFGSAVARRFGSMRFFVFFLVTAAAGAFAHLLTHGGDNAWVVGASASVSGTMAAAMRFAFQRGGPLNFLRNPGEETYRVPALSLVGVWSDPRVLGFVAVWFGINILFGLGSLPVTDQPVAWQAHIGGFLAGLFLFGWFDPHRANRVAADEVE